MIALLIAGEIMLIIGTVMICAGIGEWIWRSEQCQKL